MNDKLSNNRFLRDVVIIAGQEMTDSIRSRRALVVLALFLSISLAATLLSIKFLHAFEEALSGALMLDSSEHTGAVTATLWKNPSFREMIVHMTGDRDVALALLQFPPLSLFFMGIVFAFSPALVAFTSSARFAEEIWSGSIRFVCTRTTRLSWCIGKYFGQALQILIALLASVPVAWLCGWFSLEGFEGTATLIAMLIFAFKAWIYSMSYLGIIGCVSLFCRNPAMANALGVISVVAFSALFHTHHWAADGWRRIFDFPQMITPHYQYFDILRPDAGHVVPATIFLFAIGLGYLLIGYARLAKRDL